MSITSVWHAPIPVRSYDTLGRVVWVCTECRRNIYETKTRGWRHSPRRKKRKT